MKMRPSVKGINFFLSVLHQKYRRVSMTQLFSFLCTVFLHEDDVSNNLSCSLGCFSPLLMVNNSYQITVITPKIH